VRRSTVTVLTTLLLAASVASAAPAISVYGSWHCGSDFCTWASVRDMADFDRKNHWLIDRGDGTGTPSVNLVVLSFVHPVRLLNRTTDAQTFNGIPRGMTKEVVDYFKSHGIRVMLSIGGITYVDAWNQALASNDSAAQLALNAAQAATDLGVGIEIDYEESSKPRLAQLEAFIKAYRAVHPVDTTDADGRNPAARLTIDLAAGDRWLIALTQRATSQWLLPDSVMLDYANAMVPSRQPTASAATASWQEHIDGKPQYAPPIPPLAPAKFTGSLYIVTGSKPAPECVDFNKSLQKSTGSFVQNVAPTPAGPGVTNGMLGYMFWAAECQGTRSLCTTPPTNTCEGGVGAGSKAYTIPIPMPALRQW
jgi:hypothetical protein